MMLKMSCIQILGLLYNITRFVLHREKVKEIPDRENAVFVQHAQTVHPFPPNFTDIFITQGLRTDCVFWNIWQ